ncbi:MAG TPA: hypothetical protein DCE41_10110 [Cytophagales bacterium]|nr:hypothetical protein [Cytophagales bacterium]HAA22095.1 hypothetical protein [Cytophagales bacterium]HAP60850.1 hypothetical protein [Cytophagales bacterium]
MIFRAIPFLVVVLVFGCDRVQEIPSTLRIVNETIYDVQVVVDGDPVLTHAIPALDSINLPGLCYTLPEGYCDLGWSGSAASGSVTFDTLRVQSFLFENTTDCADRNVTFDPFGSCYGYELSLEADNESRVYTYRITQEDFDRAPPIGG